MSGDEDLPAAVWRRPPRVLRLATPARGGSACARWVGCTLGVLVAVGGLGVFAASLRAELAIWAPQPAAWGVNRQLFGPTPASWGRAHPPPNASTLHDRIPKAAHPPRCWAYGSAAERRAPAVTLMTLTVGLPKHYASCVRRARRAYASRHSLEYCEWASPLHVPRGNRSAGRAAASAGAQGGVAVSYSRQKLIGVKALLRGRSPRRALVWYLDADALVVEPSVSILARLKTNFIESETKAIIISHGDHRPIMPAARVILAFMWSGGDADARLADVQGRAGRRLRDQARQVVARVARARVGDVARARAQATVL